MTNFTLRIELIGDPSSEVYEDLHSRMKRGGFMQTVSGITPDGVTRNFQLPHATYFGSSAASAIDVRDWAKEHAKEAWGRSIVFVAQTETWVIS